MGSIDVNTISLRARTIAIIGAGPSGLVAAKYLRAEKAFDRIVLFEQRNRSGGIWNYTKDQRDEDLFTIPQTDPRGKNQDPTWLPSQRTKDGEKTGDRKEPSFLSPIYDRLETNIPRGLMGFQDLDWPQDAQLFPKHSTVLKYIQDYGADVQDLIHYETQVLNVSPSDDAISGRWNVLTRDLRSNARWNVLTRDLRSNARKEECYDAVIVANGHFIVPYLPEIAGIEAWNARHPGLISHAKYYRAPEDFTGKKVVVVGNSASGSDISTQIAQFSQRPLLWSSKSSSMFNVSASPVKRELPPIAKFLVETRGVEFEDETVEEGIDAVVFATGYFYSLPFLEGVRPGVIGDGGRVQYTYQHLFYAPRPTLSFLALPQRVIPFPIAEAQSAVLARVYAGRLNLPPLHDMQRWERNVIEEMGDGRDFHLLPFSKDGNYINELSHWAMSAEPREGLVNEGKGKIPPVWGAWEFWCRENFPKIRAAFGALGEKRFTVRTLEEVGFIYSDAMKARAKQEGKLI
ncbi:flavin-containing monooxygenase [Bimuria novae-zelandiae CBS 107.79]|uniref:Flavin-containing monooxygenase n=1 Tax=Bimuria novae-zelandiae CBS 107.79 TaxID=1447943 RepID=A0A6A5V7X1_9PLEO|nr:flavin-containing monooxygenase [Bimuria novae-zelandiae CBS 107.79]